MNRTLAVEGWELCLHRKSLRIAVFARTQMNVGMVVLCRSQGRRLLCEPHHLLPLGQILLIPLPQCSHLFSVGGNIYP